MKSKIKHWIPVFLYASLIFLVSSFPVHVSDGTDKVVHILEYAFMGFLVTRALLLTWNLSKLAGILCGACTGALLGALDELHQSFVPGRNASWGDGLADLAGAALGALVFVYLGVLLFKTDKLYPCHKDCC